MWKYYFQNSRKLCFSVCQYYLWNWLQIEWKNNQPKSFYLLPEQFENTWFGGKNAIYSSGHHWAGSSWKRKKSHKQVKDGFWGGGGGGCVWVFGGGVCFVVVVWKQRFFRRNEVKVFSRQLRNHFLRSVIIQNITSWDFIVAYSIAKLHSLGHINLLWVVWEKKTKVLHVFWAMVFYINLLPLENIKFVSEISSNIQWHQEGYRTFEAGTNLSYCSKLHCEIKKLDFNEPF